MRIFELNLMLHADEVLQLIALLPPEASPLRAQIEAQIKRAFEPLPPPTPIINRMHGGKLYTLHEAADTYAKAASRTGVGKTEVIAPEPAPLFNPNGGSTPLERELEAVAEMLVLAAGSSGAKARHQRLMGQATERLSGLSPSATIAVWQRAGRVNPEVFTTKEFIAFAKQFRDIFVPKR
jgi:hypothetical protein